MDVIDRRLAHALFVAAQPLCDDDSHYWKETRSARWTTIGALLPLAIAFVVCFAVAAVWRLVA
jgi:hypothetical protein